MPRTLDRVLARASLGTPQFRGFLNRSFIARSVRKAHVRTEVLLKAGGTSVEVIDQAVGRMQRNFDGRRQQIDAWRGHELPDVRAKEVMVDAFIGRGIDAPQHIAMEVARHYFGPEHDDFRPRTLWSVSNAFTSAFRELDPVPLMRAAASLAPFIARYQ